MKLRAYIFIVLVLFNTFTLLVLFVDDFGSKHPTAFLALHSPLSRQYDVMIGDDVTLDWYGGDGHNETTTAQVKVIILTYMRSGSSFTGDVFNHHRDVFYVYEPLYPVTWYFSRGEPAHFLHQDPVPYDESLRRLVEENVVRGYLNCSLQALYVRALTHYGLAFGQKTHDYHTCLLDRLQHHHNHTTPPSHQPSRADVLRCLPRLREPCVTSRAVVLKTVRYGMDAARRLLEMDPAVRVVHLVRDPRATLRSQRAKGMWKGWSAGAGAARFCGKVLRQWQLGEQLRKAHPGRVMTARYEDLANQPFLFAHKLLAFAGLAEHSQELSQYIWNITSAGIPDNSLSFTQRRSSKRTASGWRDRLDFPTAAAIDGQCGDVYVALGYLPLSSEERLRNVSFPSYVDVERGLTWLWV